MFVDVPSDCGRLWCLRILLALALVGFLLACGPDVERAYAARGLPAYTWHLPGDYAGDPAGNGLVPETRPDAVEANRWLVDTVISGEWCENSGIYSWSTKSGQIPSARTSRCKYTLELPHKGRYDVTLTAQIRGERVQSTRQILVDGRLIVALGDSIASGEGVPDTRHTIGGDWQNRQCHRSARAAPALAAQLIQRAEPRTPITFIHLACSGAMILEGLLDTYRGIAPHRGEAPLEPQVNVLNSIDTRRKVDAMLISIGANDVHFSEVLKRCIPRPRLLRRSSCFSRAAKLGGKPYKTLEQGIAAAVSELKPHYALLHAALPGIPPSRIFLLQYYDPTHAADGSTCRSILGIRGPILDEARKLVLEPLNRIGKEVAHLYDWHYITGISNLFDHHGYCVKGNGGWVTKVKASVFVETSFAGTLHPNAEGHRQIANLIATQLRPSLFPPPPPSKKVAASGNVPRVSTNAEIVAWICFGLGVVILILGVAIGLVLGFRKTSKTVSAKDASAKVDDAATKIDALKTTAVASAQSPQSNADAAAKASSEAAGAQSVLQEIGDIVGSLPESLRFAGLLVLIGTALMSVATVQFGGHALF